MECDDDQINDIRMVGFTYLQQGKYDIALNFFRALHVIVPNNVFDLQVLGGIYLELGKNLEALNAIDASLILDPHLKPTLLNKAKALIALGYRKQGIRQLEELLLIPDKDIHSQVRSLLQNYQ